MTRRRFVLDHQHRQRRVTTAREIWQADEIATLKSELRALRTEWAKDRAKTKHSASIRPKSATAESYGAFLDHVGAQFTRMIDKGREYFGSCPSCGNVKLACIDPLIELERLVYSNGEMDDLIFAPSLGAGAYNP